MSNLGGYQLLTTWAKKIGGPFALIGSLVCSGIAMGFAADSLIRKMYPNESKPVKNNSSYVSKVFTVSKHGTSNEGLEFNTGDTFKVLSIAGDAVLIEKDGDLNNPYFVSAELLKMITNFSEGNQNE